MDADDTLKKLLTLLLAFVIIILVALALMVLIAFILKITADVADVTPDIILAASMLVGAMIVGGAIFAKK